MIDLTKLTSKQSDGLKYAMQLLNDEITARNESLPEGVEPTPLWTLETFAERQFRLMCDGFSAELLRTKIKIGNEILESLPEEQQQQIADMLGVPNILKTE